MHKKDGVINTVANVIMYIILIIFSLMCIYPIYYVFIYSISDPILAQQGITFFPRGFSLEAYKAVFTLDSLSSAFFISVARTIIGSAVTVACCGFFGYLMTQEDMPYSKLIYRFMVITMYVGGGLIPSYLLIKNIGLLNSFWVYIIPGALGAYNVILIKTFLESIPKSLEESAQIDGAGTITIFIKIIVPVAKPIFSNNSSIFSCRTVELLV